MKIRIILITAVTILALGIGSIVWAATILKSIRVDYNIVAPTPVVGIEVYSDSAMTQLIGANYDLGDIVQSQSKQFTWYVKNTGNQPVELSSSFVITGDTIISNPNTITHLDAGTSGNWVFTLTAGSTVGARSATVNFSNNP